MAISCLLNKNLTKTDFCGYSLNQIVTIYLANYEDTTVKVTLGSDNAYEVTAVEGKWYSIAPAKDTASYEDSLVVGGNGAKYRTHSMTFSFNGTYNADLAAALDSLSLGKFIAVLKLTSGSAIMLGRTVGLEAESASSLSEAAADGNNGIQVTLSANVVEAALVVKPTALESIETSAAS